MQWAVITWSLGSSLATLVMVKLEAVAVCIDAVEARSDRVRAARVQSTLAVNGTFTPIENVPTANHGGAHGSGTSPPHVRWALGGRWKRWGAVGIFAPRFAYGLKKV